LKGPYKDLREFLARLEKSHLLRRIQRPIDKDRHLMPLVIWQYHGLAPGERRAFLFESVTDGRGNRYQGSVAVGLIGASKAIYALAMNCPEEKIRERWLEALSHPIAPKRVKSGTVKEVIVTGSALKKPDGGLAAIPIPISNPGFDGGPFFTAPFCVTKDLETGKTNIGTYRMMLKGPAKTGISCPPAQHIGIHFRKAKERGRPLEMAVVLGAVPAVGLASVSKIPYGLEEYGVAGGLAGNPLELVRCETVDLEVPAHAEIVLEGEIPTDYEEPEGPFGEYTGYMGGKMINRVFNIKCIMHRSNPILQMFNEGIPSESSLMRKLSYEAIVWKLLRQDCNIPAVERVSFHEWSGSWKYCVIQMKKTTPAQPWQALMAASAFDPNLGKVVITVDEDIDPDDPDAVNWALSFRMQPHRDTRIITHKYAALDPSAAPPGSPVDEARFPSPSGCSALLMDATRKWPYPPVALPKRAYMENAKKIWQELGLPTLAPKMPWYGYSLGHWSEENDAEAEAAVRGENERMAEKLEKGGIKL
jgi:UbiD family decarboxylase